MKRTQEEEGMQAQQQQVVQKSRPHTTGSVSSSTVNAAIDFVQRVTQASRDNEGLYQGFNIVLQAYKAGSITISEFVAKMAALFFHHHDLLLGLNAFLPKGYKSVLQSIATKQLDFCQAYNFAERIKAQDEELFKMLMNIMIKLQKGNISAEDFRNEVEDLWKNHPALMEEFVCFLPEKLFEFFNPNENARKMRTYMDTPISRLDLSDCKQHGPYRELPHNFPFPSVPLRTPLARDVLNDNLVLYWTSKDEYANPMPVNEYEKVIRRCEDDRYEADMLIAIATHTLEGLERLQDAIRQQGEVIVDDYLTAIQLKHIEHIYGEHGLEMVDTLREDPGPVVPVLLSRVQQKQNECSAFKERLSRFWADTVAKNHEKSRIIANKQPRPQEDL